jgi:hypothetical protein
MSEIGSKGADFNKLRSKSISCVVMLREVGY